MCQNPRCVGGGELPRVKVRGREHRYSCYRHPIWKAFQGWEMPMQDTEIVVVYLKYAATTKFSVVPFSPCMASDVWRPTYGARLSLFFSVTRLSRSDVRHWLTHWLREAIHKKKVTKLWSLSLRGTVGQSWTLNKSESWPKMKPYATLCNKIVLYMKLFLDFWFGHSKYHF